MNFIWRRQVIFLALIERAPKGVLHLMIIGHNPGLEDLAAELAGGGERAALEGLAKKFPTCGLAVFAFNVTSWATIRRGKGRLVHFMTPRSLE